VADAKFSLLPDSWSWTSGGGGGRADGQFWATGEYLFSWFSGDRLPVLATTSPAGTARADAGVPGRGNTTTLFGDKIVNDDLRSGFRMGLGYWFEPERICGVEAGFMIVESRATGLSATSTGTPILARPFLDATTGQFTSALIAFPGSSGGLLSARAASGDFYEAHFDLTGNVVDTDWVRVDSLLGYRFYRFDEGLSLRQDINSSPTFVPGTQFVGTDNFATKNEYHGADLGFRTVLTRDDFWLSLLTKLGVGRLSRTVKIRGGQVIEVPGTAPMVEAGNLFALSSNIGDHHTDDWTLLPEFGATLGWQVNSNVRVTLGYSVLWLDRIARAADQLDFTVNQTLLPGAGGTPTGPQRPAFMFTRNDAWLQGLSVGVEVNY
jgi:hypothetical protein